MGSEFFPIDFGRLHAPLVDFCAVALFREIAPGRRQTVEKLIFQRIAEESLRELNRATGELQDLHRLDAGDIIKKPTAARVHHNGMALHLKELERCRLVLRLHWSEGRV